MLTASLGSDVAGLTWLILGTFGFILALVFRNEIKDLSKRAENLRFRRRDTEIGADLTRPGEPESEDEQPVGSIDREESPEPPEKNSDPADVAQVESEDPTAVRVAMFRSYAEGDESQGDREYERLRVLEEDRLEGKRDEIRKHAARYMGGVDTSALDKLKTFEGDDEVSFFAHMMIGECLRHVGKNTESATEFGQAVAQAKTPEERAEAAVDRSVSLADSGKDDLAIEELGVHLSKNLDSESRARIWGGLAKIYKKNGTQELEAVALHQVAINIGNDPGRWFDAGYAYSFQGSTPLYLLALHCYRTALKLDSDQNYATNNLGVVLNLMSLPINAIAKYRESAAAGLTLSKANIADRYLVAGFADEAQKLLQAAAAEESPHKRVATVTADLESRRAAEEEKFEKLKGESARASEFMVEHANSRWGSTADLAGKWAWRNDEASVDASIAVTGKKVEISWKAESALPHRRFVGEIDGAALSGKFEHEVRKPDSTSTVWEAGDAGFGILREDGDAIRFIELRVDEADYFLLVRLDNA